MKALMKLFESQLDRQLDTQYYINCQQSPTKLLRQLKSSSEQRKLAKYIEKSTTNPFKLIKSLSVANLLLLYSNDYFSLIQNHLKSRTGKDDWLNTKFLNPYYKFIIRCCTSKQMYLSSRTMTIRKGEALEMLFYTINMLKLLFKAVEKMPLLGRYYLQKHKAVISTAIQVIALQAQKLYGSFKASLSEILYQRKTYIKTLQDQTIMKGILIDELNYINEEMKRLFLDKYFYPLGKGIGVKLFRPQEQTSECQKTIHAIITNHHDTERQKRRDQLQKTLFPDNGVVNWNFYEQTLLSCTINNITNRVGDCHYKQLDDLVIDQNDENDEDELQDEDKPDNKTTILKQKQSDKSTNTGIVQSINNQM